MKIKRNWQDKEMDLRGKKYKSYSRIETVKGWQRRLLKNDLKPFL